MPDWINDGYDELDFAALMLLAEEISIAEEEHMRMLMESCQEPVLPSEFDKDEVF